MTGGYDSGPTRGFLPCIRGLILLSLRIAYSVYVEHNQPEMYQHFKGGYYVMVRTALHHEDGTEWAIYRPLGDESTYYVRPLSEFDDPKIREGDGENVTVPRFRLLSNREANEVMMAKIREKAQAAMDAAVTDEDKVAAHLGMLLVDKIEARLQEGLAKE